MPDRSLGLLALSATRHGYSRSSVLDGREAQFVEDYGKYTYPELMKRYSICHNTVLRWAVKLRLGPHGCGFCRRNGGWADGWSDAWLITWWLAGVPRADIAAGLGANPWNVSSRVLCLDLPRRLTNTLRWRDIR